MPDTPPSVSFTHNGQSHVLSLPPAASDRASVFVIGLPKAGSTLLNRILRPLLIAAGLVPYSSSNQMRQLGIPLHDQPLELVDLWQPRGYAYVGMRGLTRRLPLPLFAAGRTVLLVRDPRDMVVSQYYSEAYSHRPPGTDADTALLRQFDASRLSALVTPIDDYAIDAAEVLADSYRTTVLQLMGIAHATWRYEDVIFDKLTWVTGMLDYLGISLPLAMVERVVGQNDLRPDREHLADHVRKVTPGDHREKLDPATIHRLNDILEQMLTDHGYL